MLHIHTATRTKTQVYFIFRNYSLLNVDTNKLMRTRLKHPAKYENRDSIESINFKVSVPLKDGYFGLISMVVEASHFHFIVFFIDCCKKSHTVSLIGIVKLTELYIDNIIDYKWALECIKQSKVKLFYISSVCILHHPFDIWIIAFLFSACLTQKSLAPVALSCNKYKYKYVRMHCINIIKKSDTTVSTGAAYSTFNTCRALLSMKIWNFWSSQFSENRSILGVFIFFNTAVTIRDQFLFKSQYAHWYLFECRIFTIFSKMFEFWWWFSFII